MWVWCTQAPCRAAERPSSQRLTVHAAKGKVAKESLIDGRTVPKDLPEARAHQHKTRGSVHKVSPGCSPQAVSQARAIVAVLLVPVMRPVMAFLQPVSRMHLPKCASVRPALDLWWHAQFRRALDTIRGRKYNEALIFMSYLPYRACEKLVVLLKSVS